MDLTSDLGSMLQGNRPVRKQVKKYSPDQPRAEDGKWTSGGDDLFGGTPDKKIKEIADKAQKLGLKEDQAQKLAEIYVSSEAKKPEFDAEVKKAADAVNGTPVTPPLKSLERASEKISAEYKGDASRIKDVMRATVEVQNPEDAKTVIETFSKDYKVVGNIRNTLDPSATTGPDGYRDAKINVQVPGDHIAELQVNLPSIVTLKDTVVHPMYEARQKLERLSSLTADQVAEINSLNTRMKATYDAEFSKLMARWNASKLTTVPFRKTDPSGNGRGGDSSNARTSMPPSSRGTMETGTPSTSQYLYAGSLKSDITKDYNPDQPRDEKGRWAAGDESKLKDLFSRSLGMQRADMPQIPQAKTHEFLAALSSRGIGSKAETVDAASLKPTQANYNTAALDRARAGYASGALKEHPSIISSDNYVLDGHHRWALAALDGQTLNVVRVDLPIRDLIQAGLEFDEQQGIEHRKVAKFSPDQPRDEHGRWTSGGAGFASGNEADETYDFTAAQSQYASDAHRAFIAKEHEIDQRLGIQADHAAALGDTREWGTETSTYEQFAPGTSMDQIETSMAMKGWIGNQKGVIAFQADPNGTQRLYNLSVPNTDLNQIREQLDKHGLDFRTFVPQSNGSRVLIFDQDGSQGDKVEAFMHATEASGGYIEGTGRIIEGTGTRASARSVYEGIINASAASSETVRATWDWLRNQRVYQPGAEKARRAQELIKQADKHARALRTRKAHKHDG